MNLPKLHTAILYTDIDTVKKLLSDNSVDVNEVDVRTDTPLILAAINGNVEIFTMLFNREDIDINARNRYNECAFYHAVYRGHIEIVKMMVYDSRLNFIGCHAENTLRNTYEYLNNN